MNLMAMQDYWGHSLYLFDADLSSNDCANYFIAWRIWLLGAHYICYFYVQKWCKACVLLEGLNRGLPKLGIGRTRVLNNERNNAMKQNKNIDSKKCGSLDFWCSWTAGQKSLVFSCIVCNTSNFYQKSLRIVLIYFY